ncbi:MAG: hypothetical protein U0V73_12445 [Acidimicrobiia bacterium]
MAYLAEGEVGLVDSIKADFAAYRKFFGGWGKPKWRTDLDVLSWTMFHAVVVVRLARAAQRAGLFPIARLLMYLNEVIFLVELSPHAVIGPGLVLVHPGSGCAAYTRIGRNCIMVGMVHLGVGGYTGDKVDGPPTIGDDVVFMAGSSVFGPVTVGSRSAVGNGVRLLKSLPEDSAVFAPQRQIVTRRPGAPPPASEPAPDPDVPAGTPAGDGTPVA